MKKLVYISTLFIAFFCLCVFQSFAQENPGLNVTVSPTLLEVTEKPGATLTGKFRLRNNSAAPLKLSVKADKLNADAEGRIIPAPGGKNDTYLSWLTFDQTTFDALPKEWTEISYTVTIPEEAAFGYYYAIHISQTAVETQDSTTVLGEIVIPLLLDVQKDGAQKEAKLLSFKSPTLINEYFPVEFAATIENTGNVHLKPRGNIFIRGAADKDLGILEINPGLGSLLPRHTRTFTTSWTDGFLVKEEIVEDGAVKLDSHGNPMTTVKINWNKLTEFRFGKYTAHLLMVYDNGSRDVVMEHTTSFWVIPYTAIGIGILTLLVLFFTIRLLLRRYITNQIAKLKS